MCWKFRSVDLCDTLIAFCAKKEKRDDEIICYSGRNGVTVKKRKGQIALYCFCVFKTTPLTPDRLKIEVTEI